MQGAEPAARASERHTQKQNIIFKKYSLIFSILSGFEISKGSNRWVFFEIWLFFC
jgi:hypothetical protein